MQARYRTPLIVATVGVVIGVVIGRWIYTIADQPSMASMLAVFAVFGFVLVLAVALLVGLVAVVIGDRAAGGSLLLMTVAAGIGAAAAFAYRDGPQFVAERSAHIEVTLGPPIDETFTGRGTCLTVANDDAIGRVQGDPFISIDAINWSVSLVIEQASSRSTALGSCRTTTASRWPDTYRASWPTSMSRRRAIARPAPRRSTISAPSPGRCRSTDTAGRCDSMAR